VRIDVLPARQLNFEGSGESGNRQFLKGFVEGVKSGLPGGTFLDFSHLWVPPGVQAGVQFGSKTHFLGSEKKYKKRTKTRPQKGGCCGTGARVWGHGKSAISEKSVAKHWGKR